MPAKPSSVWNATGTEPKRKTPVTGEEYGSKTCGSSHKRIRFVLPSWLIDPEPWGEFWPLPLSAIVVAFIVAAFVHHPNRLRQRYLITVGAMFAMALLGIVTGKIMGQSREAAVGTVMPAILTFLGGALIYILNTRGVRQQIMGSAAVIGFTLCLALGIHWGATARVNAELNALKLKEIAKFKATLQKRVNDRRLDGLERQLNQRKKSPDRR